MNTNPKALFASIYYGQKIFRYGEHDEQTYEISGLQIDGIADSEIGYPDCFLELRSVSDLTDEEAIQCAKCGSTFFDVVNTSSKGYEIKVIRELRVISVAAVIDGGRDCLVKIQVNEPWKLNIAQIDYLRSIGILLPFTYLPPDGKPITLSTEEIIKNGWAKEPQTKKNQLSSNI